MDEIYPPRIKELTNVQQFYHNFNLINAELLENINSPSSCNQRPNFPSTDDDIKKCMNFQGSDYEFKNIIDSVSINNHLSSLNDIRQFEFDPNSIQKKTFVEFDSNALKLNRIQEIIETLSKVKEEKRERLYQNKYKYLSYNIKIENEIKNMDVNEEVVLSVRFHEPFRHLVNVRNYYHPKFRQEFHVLGSNFLSELRDRIYCQCNFGPFVDISENPFAEHEHSHIDSGFFYINGVIYNDTRKPEMQDYSKIILEWAQNNIKNGVGEIKTEIMDETRFIDLEFHVGAPCVYQHFGNCEHVFTISNVSLLSKAHSLHRQNYPHLYRISHKRYTHCNLCGRSEASFIVRKSQHHIHDPSYLCTHCFKSYHYIDGKKTGKFEAYKYYGNHMIGVLNQQI